MKSWALSQIAEGWWVVVYGPETGPVDVTVAFSTEAMARQFLKLQLTGTHAITYETAPVLAAGGYYEGRAA